MLLTVCLFRNNYVLGAGEYLVNSDLTQKTWLRRWGSVERLGLGDNLFLALGLHFITCPSLSWPWGQPSTQEEPCSS